MTISRVFWAKSAGYQVSFRIGSHNHHLADALAEKAAGAPPARLKELAQTLRHLVSEAETAVQPDLDGMYFNMLVAGFLEHTGEAQE